MSRRLISLVLLLASVAVSAQQPAPARPRLIVILVVDQMRTDYLERATPHLTAGLKRLTLDGAWFREGAYPYLNTVTCAGHATIGTGALPYHHGMVLNAWLDRSIGRERACTADETVQNIAYSSATVTGGDSARSLLVPTLAQKVREAGGRTVAMSLKPRSAITLTGTNPTAVIWLNDRAGWTTSSAFTPTRIDWVEKFVAANPIAADGGKVWDRMLPADKYAGSDDGLGERVPTGWTRTFPHPVSQAGAPEFMAQW